MSAPTHSDVDDAIPINGSPSRAKVNAVLKNMISAIGPFSNVVDAPIAMDSPGQPGDYAIHPINGIYICVAENDWRVIDLMGFE